MNLLNKTLAITVLILSPVANAGLMLDTAIISYGEFGYLGFEYTGDSVWYSDDEPEPSEFEVDFGAGGRYIDFNLITIAMDIQDLAIQALEIRFAGRFPGALEDFSATGLIDGLNCSFGEIDGGCLDPSDPSNYDDFIQATLFATYKEVPASPINDVPEPTTLAMLGLGLFGLGVARRRITT